VLVFSKLQNGYTGELFAEGLAEVNYLAVAIVTAIGIVISAVLYFIGKRREEIKA
jgi:hypothetical protein